MAAGESMTEPMRRAVIVFNALHSGGAERTGIAVARYLQRHYDLHVIALLDGGPAEQELRALGIRVTVLNARGLAHRALAILKLARILRRTRPQIVITFLYLADLVAGSLARLLVPGVRVYWNIRNNVLGRHQVGLLSHVASRLNARLSGLIPDAIAYCSDVARAQHEAIGYHNACSRTVHNSAATVPFGFSMEKRAAFRQGRAEKDFVFLFVGRFDPVKRVDVFIEACARLLRQSTPGHAGRFVLAGRGMEQANPWLRHAIEATGVAAHFELLGHVEDPQTIYSGADCLVVTSESEGSPNAVYEAIATRLPVLILATRGTEHIADPGVHRLATREIDNLVQAMAVAQASGIQPGSARMPKHGPVSETPEHPLVPYYKELLGDR